MSAEQVALIPQCVECGDFWLPDDGERWRAYLDTDDEVVNFCVECGASSTFRNFRTITLAASPAGDPAPKRR